MTPSVIDAARALLEALDAWRALTAIQKREASIEDLWNAEESLRTALASASETVEVPSDLVVGLTAVSTQPRYAGWVFVKHIDEHNWTTGAKLTPETWGMVQQQIAALQPAEVKNG